MDLRYPIGKFEKPELIDDKQLSDWIKIMADPTGSVDPHEWHIFSKNLTSK